MSKVGISLLGRLILVSFSLWIACCFRAQAQDEISPLTASPRPSVASGVFQTKTSRYQHPSFIAGIALLSVGAIAGTTGAVLQARSCNCTGFPAWPVAYILSGVSLLSGSASMIYWGVRVNVP